jgi:tRNA-(ms[2]io[6]A)-hydroxylase
MVLDLLESRSIKFQPQRPSNYGKLLNDLVRKGEPLRALDRLLVAGLIEARSCERFAVLRDGLQDRNLASFYGSLFESEARHHSTYVRLANHFATETEVHCRLEELAFAEAKIIDRAGEPPRVHS